MRIKMKPSRRGCIGRWKLTQFLKTLRSSSRVLIVLCSPAAKTSHWVNEEIRLFRSLHGEGSILCVLAEGTPETSFPPALLEEGREPLAANLGESKDSFRLGTTQLAASMLGVGLDVLIQRESKRRRRRLQLVTAFALVFSGLMGATALTAIDARNDAQDSRSQAEGLVEYMITDLKDKLEPLGKLDILDSVGDEAVKYYDSQNINELSDESLTRQAKARHILGQVALIAENLNKAQTEIEAAAVLTEEVYNRNPNDSEAIFAHAQSEYWVGEMHLEKESYERAMLHWQKYANLGEKLHQLNPLKFKWIMERGYGLNNIAYLHGDLGNFDTAQNYYSKAIDYYKSALNIKPNNHSTKKSLANAFEGASYIAIKNNTPNQAKEYKERQIKILADILQDRPQDINIKYLYNRARFKAYILQAQTTISSCNSNQSNTFLEEFKVFLSHDKSNYNWHENYIENWYNLLTTCRKSYSNDEYNQQMNNLLSHANEFLSDDTLIDERAYINSLVAQ